MHLLDGVRVPVYGSDMPLNQVATVATPDNQTLSVTVWDINNAGAVEKAIRVAFQKFEHIISSIYAG